MGKNKKILLALTALMTASAMSSVFAVAPLPMGWYLEANGGNAKVSNASYAANSSTSTSGIGWNLNAGYKFMPFFATEVGYTQYANTSSKVAGVKIATASTYSYDIAAKPLLPIGDTGAEFFAKLGVAHLHSNVKASNTTYANANGIAVSTGTSNVNGYYFGLGADYSFLPAAAVNAQWQRAKGNSNTGTWNLYSIGVSYLFG